LAQAEIARGMFRGDNRSSGRTEGADFACAVIGAAAQRAGLACYNVRIPMKSPRHSEMMSPGVPT
jgi:hypothetical protein